MSDIKSVSQRQSFQVIRELIGLRNMGALQEDWNDADAAFQRGPNLDAHEVIGLLQAPLILLVTCIEPTRTDDRQQRITLRYLFSEHLDEVGTERNRVNIHEQEIAPELPLQSVMHPASVACTVVATVTN